MPKKNETTPNVPALRFSEFEEVWKEVLLKGLMTFKNGVNASKEDYGKGYKFINVLDIIENDFIDYESIRGFVDVTEDVFKKNVVEYGDVLFQRSSETREEVGQANVYLDKNRNATFGGFVIRGKRAGEYIPSFMNYLLKSAAARKEITSKSGGSTRYNVSQSTLSNVKVILPTLPEQQKIANFLTAADKRIELVQQQVMQWQAYKKGIMQQLFSQAIRFRDEDGEVFGDWEEKRLGEIGEFFSGGTPTSSMKEYYTGDIPFIKSGEISSSNTEQYINKKALEDSSAKMVCRGDLLMAIYGATSGQVAISKLEGAINQAVVCIRGGFDSIFLFSYFEFNRSRLTRKYLQGGQGNLSSKILKSISVSFPSEQEQQKISSFLTAIDERINLLEQQVEQLQIWKKGLLQQMLV
ncbi:MAG: restriction endonuclease subunit S [Bacteroidota bacterium]